MDETMNVNANESLQEVVAKAVRDAIAEMHSTGEGALSIPGSNEELKDLIASLQTTLVNADAAKSTMDYVAVKENITDFKDTIEQCNQTMDQLRKQLNRERNNNDRTITELYRSMKYSEERIEELHANYDEFTTVINSHKNIMGILVWLNIVVIVAMIIMSLLNLLS